MNYISEITSRLDTVIESVSANISKFVRNPEKDFTRKNKLPFTEMIRLILSLGGGTLNSELLDYYKYNPNVATASAFVQQRAKILPEAFNFLFRSFTDSLDVKLYGNYRLFAVDGSDANLSQNPDDYATFIKREKDTKGCNLLHLNALYDLISKLYVDFNTQPKREADENRAFVEMVDKSTIKEQVILTADRGYESYNNLAHIAQKGWKFLIRVKLGGKGILSSLKIPDDAFDIDINLQFTRNRDKAKSNHLLKLLANNTVFDYLLPDSDDVYTLSFRAVRFQLPNGEYEAVLTNLNRDEFRPGQLMELYHMRWGIETSFRDLKHTIGLAFPHSKKSDSILQEIAARLTLYNFCEAIVTNAVIKQKETKYIYEIDFTTAVKVCRKFLRDIVKSGVVEILIKKYLHPVKDNRSFSRCTSNAKWTNFWYRIS